MKIFLNIKHKELSEIKSIDDLYYVVIELNMEEIKAIHDYYRGINESGAKQLSIPNFIIYAFEYKYLELFNLGEMLESMSYEFWNEKDYNKYCNEAIKFLNNLMSDKADVKQ